MYVRPHPPLKYSLQVRHSDPPAAEAAAVKSAASAGRADSALPEAYRWAASASAACSAELAGAGEATALVSRRAPYSLESCGSGSRGRAGVRWRTQ